MKTLIIISMLALPLCAQDAKLPPIPDSSTKTIQPPSANIMLPTSDEIASLAVGFIEFQQSQIQWLQKFQTDQAGISASTAMNQASAKYEKLLKPLVTKYYPSCPAAYWDFSNHKWFCPPPDK